MMSNHLSCSWTFLQISYQQTDKYRLLMSAFFLCQECPNSQVVQQKCSYSWDTASSAQDDATAICCCDSSGARLLPGRLEEWYYRLLSQSEQYQSIPSYRIQQCMYFSSESVRSWRATKLGRKWEIKSLLCAKYNCQLKL